MSPARLLRPTLTEAVSRWITLAVTVALIVTAMVSNATYTQRVDQESDRDFCGILNALDTPEAPPTTTRAELIAREVHTLRQRKGCIDGRNPASGQLR